MKKCPHCAESIKNEALLCRFCGRKIKQPGANDTLISMVTFVVFAMVLGGVGWAIWGHYKQQIQGIAQDVTEKKFYCRDNANAAQKIVTENRASAAEGCTVVVKDQKSGRKIFEGKLTSSMVESIATADKLENSIPLETAGENDSCKYYVAMATVSAEYDPRPSLDKELQSIDFKPCDRVAYIVSKDDDENGEVITSGAEVVINPITWRVVREQIGETPQYVLNGPVTDLGTVPAIFVNGQAALWARSEFLVASSLNLSIMQTVHGKNASAVTLEMLSEILAKASDRMQVSILMEGSVVSYKGSISFTEQEYQKRVSWDNANNYARCDQTRAVDPEAKCPFTYPITNNYLRSVKIGMGKIDCQGAQVDFQDGEKVASSDYGKQKADIYASYFSQCISK